MRSSQRRIALSWFDLGVVIPRFADLLIENGVLAALNRTAQVEAREDDLSDHRGYGLTGTSLQPTC